MSAFCDPEPGASSELEVLPSEIVSTGGETGSLPPSSGLEGSAVGQGVQASSAAFWASSASASSRWSAGSGFSPFAAR